ncbi:MAG: GldG family protein, partial [Rhodospirillales bacterium]
MIAIGFVATVMLSNNALRSSRIDLTDDGLFTLSQGTRNVLANLDEPLTLRFYFSSRLSREIPQIGIYGQRVQDMLEEFSAESRGKIRLEVYDPEPFSDVEDRAVGFGLKGVPVDQTG